MFLRIQRVIIGLFTVFAVIGAVELLAAEADSAPTRNQMPDSVSMPAALDEDLPSYSAPDGSDSAYFGPSLGFDWGEGVYYDLGKRRFLSWRAVRHEERDIESLHGSVGVRLHIDAADYDADDSLEPFEDTIDIRRLRLYTQGEFFFVWPALFKVEADYTDEEFYWREAFVSFRDAIWLCNLKVGHFRAPMSLAAYGGGRASTLMEHSSPVQAFQPGIKFGAELSGWSFDERMTYAIGWFADGEDSDIGESSTSFTRGIGRVTGLPYYADEGSKLVHVGFGGHYLFSDQSEIRFRSRPESRFAPYVVDTGNMDADQAALWAVEAAVVHGPYSLQSEVFQTTVFSGDDDAVFYGGYISASWFLTGETRPYNKASGTFQIVQPAQQFSIEKKTPGAWELGLRLSYLDLSSKGIQGGELTMGTAGLNWYLSRRLRLMFNYSHGQVENSPTEGDLDIFQSRLQIDF